MLFNLLSDSVKWYPILFDSPENVFRSVAIWLALAMIISFIVLALAIKGDKRKLFLRVSLILAVAYACLVGVASMVFWLKDAGENGEFLTILFVPLVILILSIAFGVIFITLNKTRTARIVSLLFIGASFIAVIVCMSIHFASDNAADMNGITSDQINSIGLILSALILTAIVVITAFLCEKGPMSFDTSSISYAGVCIALSFALSYLRIIRMPQGGSITLASLLPLMIYSHKFGVKKGVFVGFVYGLLQSVQDAYIIHPAQFILDYPVAFSCMGLAGIFAKNSRLERLPQIKFALGGALAGIMRFAMHFISGSFAFAAFAGDQNPFLYSFIYQAGYVLPDVAIVIIAGIFVFSSASFRRFILPNNAKA